MPKEPEGVKYQTDWEDSECASVVELVCSCGTNLLEGYTPGGYTVSHDDKIECPRCGKKYQFIWHGMALKELTNASYKD